MPDHHFGHTGMKKGAQKYEVKRPLSYGSAAKGFYGSQRKGMRDKFYDTARRTYVTGNFGPLTSGSKYYTLGANLQPIAKVTTSYTTSTRVNFAGSAVINYINNMGNGTSITQRIGRQSALQSIKVRGVIHMPDQIGQSGLDTYNLIRVAMVQDTQVNGASPTPANVFADSGAGGDAFTMLTFQNLNFLNRYRVVKDRWFKLPHDVQAVYNGGTTNVQIAGFTFPFSFTYTPKQPILCTHNATGSATQDDSMVSNGFFIIAAYQDPGVEAGNDPQIAITTRVKFTDAGTS